MAFATETPASQSEIPSLLLSAIFVVGFSLRASEVEGLLSERCANFKSSCTIEKDEEVDDGGERFRSITQASTRKQRVKLKWLLQFQICKKDSLYWLS